MKLFVAIDTEATLYRSERPAVTCEVIGQRVRRPYHPVKNIYASTTAELNALERLGKFIKELEDGAEPEDSAQYTPDEADFLIRHIIGYSQDSGYHIRTALRRSDWELVCRKEEKLLNGNTTIETL